MKRLTHLPIRPIALLLLIAALILLTACSPTAPAEGQAADPQTAVEGFYEWYLAYPGEPGSEDFRNPLVDRAYREAPYVSDAFVAAMDTQLDQQIEEFGGLMGDPILQAQDLPTRFEVGPGPAEDVVTVTLYFGETPHPIQVRVVEEDGAWLLADIIPRGSTLP